MLANIGHVKTVRLLHLKMRFQKQLAVMGRYD